MIAVGNPTAAGRGEHRFGRRGRQRWIPPLAAAIVFAAGTSAAQDRPRQPYVTAGIGLFHQAGPSGEVSQVYVTAPGGTTAGWFVGGGVSVARGVSIDVELSQTGLMTAREPSRYGETYNVERRDRHLALALRFGLPPAAGIRLEPLAGVAFTFPHAVTETHIQRLTSPPGPPIDEPPVTHELETGAGLFAGADLRIGNHRIALMPSFRLFDIGVSGGKYRSTSERREISAIFPGGYPRLSMRSGVALRLNF